MSSYLVFFEDFLFNDLALGLAVAISIKPTHIISIVKHTAITSHCQVLARSPRNVLRTIAVNTYLPTSSKNLPSSSTHLFSIALIFINPCIKIHIQAKGGQKQHYCANTCHYIIITIHIIEFLTS